MEKEQILRHRAEENARKEIDVMESIAKPVEVLKFSLLNRLYALDIKYVSEVSYIREITPIPGTPQFVAGVINLRGKIISAISIKTLFSLEERGLTEQNRLIVLKNNSNIANEDLDAFARTVSHDLKSPLTVILGFSSAILDNAQSNVSQEEKSYIEFMRESALEMNQLIKDLLSFSQSGRINLEKEEVDLSQIANDMIDSILLRFPGTSPQITIEPNMKVFADPRMMRVVLDNLLGNAVKYSSKNSSPQITFAKREYYGKELFYVKDNGVGFDMSKADKLFQPFVRLHSQSDYSGTGVGLSTVKRIIDKHSGEIWAESEPGKGTEFLFFLG